jgi:hypothetical protein
VGPPGINVHGWEVCHRESRVTVSSRHPDIFDQIAYTRAITRLTHFANNTCSHGNNFSNVSTATNQHITEVLLGTVFSMVVRVNEIQAGQSED